MDKLFQNKYEACELRPTQLYQISEKVDHQELKYGRSDWIQTLIHTNL